MKKIFVFIFLLILLINASYPKQNNKMSEADKIISTFKYPEIKWSIPVIGKDIERIVLNNGMTVFIKEEHMLPITNISVIVKTGEIYETAQNHCINELTASMMESAGTEKYPKEILNEKIENLGAIVSCYSGIESSGAYLSILSKYNDEGLDILSQILRYPVFNQNELDIEKGIIKESIIRKNDDPDSITQTEFNKIIYGDHPYGRDLQWPVVSKITREDLIGWYNSYYHPNNIMMAVYGDFNKKEMLEKINNYFGNWKKEETAYPEIPKVTNIFHPGIYLYNKDLTQAYIYIGHLGINFDNPDKYAVIVLNQIMGAGGFTSRLFKKVRTENGLAYRVGSSFSAGGRDTGQFFVYCQTKNNSASKAIKLILNEINYLRKNPVFDSEINTAKDSIINSYVFSFENSFSVIQKLMNLEYFNRPSDYYQNYIKNIKKVTKLDVLNAAKKYLHPDELTFVVVGKATDLEKQLSEFGKVTVRQPEGFRE